MDINVLQVYDFNELYNTSWSGAIDTLDTIREHDKEEELLFLINDLLDCYEDKGISRTQLNDCLWFDRDEIFASLGIEEED